MPDYPQAYGLLDCPTGTWPFSLSGSGGSVSAVGQFSSTSDGNSTSVTIDLDVTDPTGEAAGYLFAIGYFQLDFDEATPVSFDYDVQHVQGNAGSISVVQGCDDPNGTAVPTASGIDFYFGPGGRVLCLGQGRALVQRARGLRERALDERHGLSPARHPVPRGRDHRRVRGRRPESEAAL